MTDSSAYRQALAFLEDRHNYERSDPQQGADDFRLDHLRSLLSRLGAPQCAAPTIHIAGSKGKGSVSSMLAAILTAAGYRTGLYSSPHLHRVEERIAVDGQICPSEEFVELVDSLRPVVEAHERERGCSLTYFELITALAWLHFAHRQVDAIVLETGLGGRLDSTNVCSPLLCVITSISLEHTRLLGNTLEAIAAEKAGIIKPGAAVVSSVLAPAAREVIEQTAERNESAFFQLERDYHYTYDPPASTEPSGSCGRIDYRETGGVDWKGVRLGLLGRHQGANAATALAVVRRLQEYGWNLPEDRVREGLRTVCCPARVELLQQRPCVVLDTAHNGASITALLETLQTHFPLPPGGKRRLVFSCSQDKNAAEMLQMLSSEFDQIVLTRYLASPRTTPPPRLLAALREVAPQTSAIVCETPREAWRAVREEASEEDLICIAGSFFLAAEMREIWAAPLDENAKAE